jgi:hypothetical protein
MVLVSSCNETPPSLRPLIAPPAAQVEEPPPEDVELVRPDGAIFFANNFCACNNGKSVIISGSTCNNFCSNKQTNNQDLLYMNFTVGNIIITEGYGDTAGWCNLAISDSDNPRCVLEVRSEAGAAAPIDVSVVQGNSFTANISALPQDTTFILTLTEVASGAKSNSIQIRKFTDNSSAPPVGPLIVQPVTQYTCINRRPLEDTNTGVIFYENAVKLHFYFIERFRPQPVPFGVNDVFCHDITLNGNVDNSAFPRLEETPGVFGLWSTEDIRFFDLNSSGVRDVNEIIAQKAADLGAPFSSMPNLFFPLTMSSGPTINIVGNVATSGAPLGFYMSFFNDVGAGNVSYCPKQAQYESNEIALKAIGEVVQVDTEGIYLAKRETLTFFNPEENQIECLPMDILITRESDVKRAWFYINPANGQPTQPLTINSLRNNTIRFYYPFDFNSPYIKKSNQMEYTIITPDQVSQGTCSQDNGGVPNTTSGGNNIPTSYTPHDRRFGCIPASSN